MDREKQIDEMAKVIDDFTEPLSARDIHKAEFSEQFAEALYDAGYRKQSDIAKEIFDALKEKLIFNTYGIATISDKTFCELKKEYDFYDSNNDD